MRLILLVVLVALLTGCTSTRSVNTADPAALSELDQRLRGQSAQVVLASGERETGRIRSVRADSVSWLRDGAMHSVATAEVDKIIRDNRAQSTLHGLGLGVGIGAVVSALAFTSDGLGALVYQNLSVPVGAFYGTTIGAALGRRRVYVLQE